MANRSFQDYASSGELLELYMGGIQPEHKVPTALDVTTEINEPKDSVLLTPQLTPPTAVEGLSFYDDNAHDIGYYTDVDGVLLHLGTVFPIRVVNKTASPIPAGKVIRNGGIDITTGEIKSVYAKADLLTTAFAIGFTAVEIPVDGESWLIKEGPLKGIDTSLLALGGTLFLSDINEGEVVQTVPDIASALGTVKVVDVTNGEIYVKIDNLITYPQATGALRGQNTPLYSVTTTAQDIVDFIDKVDIILTANTLTGEFTVPLNGHYQITFTAIPQFASSTSTRTIYFELYNATLATVVGAYPRNIPRDATEEGMSFTAPLINAIAGHTYKMRVRASVSVAITFDNMAFLLTSNHLGS